MNEMGNISLSDLIKSNPVVEEKPVEKEKSPLEKMKEYQENNPGMIIDKKDITYDDEKKEFKNSIENDRREDEFQAYLNEMDETIEMAKKVKLLKKPTNQIEDAALMDQIDLLRRQEGGLKVKNPKNVNGQEMNIGDEEREGTSLLPTNFVTKSDDNTVDEKDNDVVEEIDSLTEEEQEKNLERQKLVEVLIDKTGFGNRKVDFTEEEREKMAEASLIRVTEVEDLEISSFEFSAPEESYVDKLESMDSTYGTTLVPLVASRYRAKMKGLGYGQLADLLMDIEEPRFEQHLKRYSIIYNNIVETSVGKFDSFEDFLKSTAKIDMDVLLYGLMVSTYPELDSVAITCGRCRSQFEQKYFVRDLMDIRNASTEYLKKLDELMTCPEYEYENFFKDSPVHKRKYIQLPTSKHVVEIGVASAYDYLYKVINNYGDKQFEKNHADDINASLRLNILYLDMVRSISIPDKNNPKKLYKYESFEDVIQILYRLPMKDQQILNGIIGRYYNNYTIGYSIKNSKCPNCNNTIDTDVDLNDLLFFKVNQLLNTAVEVKNMQDL